VKKTQKKSVLFIIIKALIRLFYPKIAIEGMDNIPEGPVIIVGNHAQIHGPIASELYFPDNFYTWCAGQMMELKEVPQYAYTDFWSQKPKYMQPFFKVLAYLIAPLSVVVFNHARTIAVYHDARIMRTFKDTITKLQEDKAVVIFPEHDVKHNHIVYAFQEGFVDVARLYEKRTGKPLHFVPLYIAPNLKKMYLGKPITFCKETPPEEERKRICDYLMQEITNMAEALPVHTVVPYRNIPKKDYPKNRQMEES